MLAAPSAQATFPGANGKIVDQALFYYGGGDLESSYYVHLINQDGTGETAVTGTEENYSPSVSPDGQKILFTCNYQNLCTMNVDGTGRTTIFSQSSGFPPQASFSPDGTKIVFSNSNTIYVMNADGSGAVSLGVTGELPVWSPDRSKIAFDDYRDVYVMHADGTGQTRVTDGAAPATNPSWSPDGSRIAFSRLDSSQADVYSIRLDGTGETGLTTSPDFDGSPAWSPDGQKIAFGSTRDHVPADPGFFDDYVSEVYVMNADGTGQTRLTRNDLIDPPGRSSFSPSDWQPIPINAYPRPKGATPLRVSLVPAQQQCTAPNKTHGAPLAFGSCGPPQLTSGQLTTGTPDANRRAARMNAYLLLKAVPGSSTTPADEADVQITAHLNDVANKDLTDYTGALRASLPLRITDKDNTPSPGGPGAATTVPFQYRFDIPCTPDPTTNVGSDCSISTTADTLVPGTIKESLRTVWQIGRVRVDDAGPDGNPDTTADNTVFAVQGVFVP
jgi:Tol biopolymer transport system component